MAGGWDTRILMWITQAVLAGMQIVSAVHRPLTGRTDVGDGALRERRLTLLARKPVLMLRAFIVCRATARVSAGADACKIPGNQPV